MIGIWDLVDGLWDYTQMTLDEIKNRTTSISFKKKIDKN